MKMNHRTMTTAMEAATEVATKVEMKGKLETEGAETKEHGRSAKGEGMRNGERKVGGEETKESEGSQPGWVLGRTTWLTCET